MAATIRQTLLIPRQARPALLGKPQMAENNQVDVKKLTFERAIEELESIVKRLEEGKGPLGESVAIDERGGAGGRWQRPPGGAATTAGAPRGQDHSRRLRPADRDRAARRAVTGTARRLA